MTNIYRATWAKLPALTTFAATLGLLAPVSCGGGSSSTSERDGTQSASTESVAEVESAVTSCRPGFILVCEPGCPPAPCTKPVCECDPDPNYNPPVEGTVTPLFYVTHVVYTPPGKSSSITYTSGTSIGSTTSASSSFKTDEKITVGASGGFLAKGSVSVSLGESWGSTQTDVTDVAYSFMNGYKKSGQSDAVDHDHDEIWFLAQPLIEVSITRATASAPQSTQWQFASDQSQAVPYFVYVGELRDPSTMPADVSSTLASFGITSDYYPDLLAADPFAGGAGPNPAIDPNRFDEVDTLPYEPPLDAGDQPSSQTYTESRNQTNSSTNQSDFTQSVGLTVGVSGSFFSLFNASLSNQSTWTWTHTSSKKESAGSSAGETLVVGQPAFGYSGPTILHVYVDKIWKTYFFSLDWLPSCSGSCGAESPAGCWCDSFCAGYGDCCDDKVTYCGG